MRLTLYLGLSYCLAVHGLPTNPTVRSSIEELQGPETSFNDGLLPRRGPKSITALPPSQTSTNKSPLSPEKSVPSIPPSSTQAEPPSRTPALGHFSNVSYTTSTQTGIPVHGNTTPSASELPGPSTAGQRTHVYGSQSHHVPPKVAIVIVCVLVAVLIVVAIGLCLWWKKRSMKKQRGWVYRAVRVDTTEESGNVWPVGAAE